MGQSALDCWEFVQVGRDWHHGGLRAIGLDVDPKAETRCSRLESGEDRGQLGHTTDDRNIIGVGDDGRSGGRDVGY